ncbi:MAG TPA: transposase [Microvirga sp.]|nr:transposase [Microvirga sp.]
MGTPLPHPAGRILPPPVPKEDHQGSTELASIMVEGVLVLSGPSSIAGKAVHVTFDGGRLTSDAGVLMLAEVERRLGLAERLARCLVL